MSKRQPKFSEELRMARKRKKKKDIDGGFYKTPKSVAFAQMRVEGGRHTDRGLSKVR